MSWRDSAACKGVEVQVFIPNTVNGKLGRNTYAKARAFCDVCSVKKQCLMYALDEDIEFGMYGGTVPKERRILKNRQVAV